MKRNFIPYLIAIDLGTCYSGIAIADSYNLIPAPLGTIFHNKNGDLKSLSSIKVFYFLSSINVMKVIVGCKNFNPILSKITSLYKLEHKDIIYMDERYTSKLANKFHDFEQVDIHARSAYFLLSQYLKVKTSVV